MFRRTLKGKQNIYGSTLCLTNVLQRVTLFSDFAISSFQQERVLSHQQINQGLKLGLQLILMCAACTPGAVLREFGSGTPYLPAKLI